jgi:hypothetical protein
MSLKKSNRQNHQPASQYAAEQPVNLQSATATEKGGLNFER